MLPRLRSRRALKSQTLQIFKEILAARPLINAYEEGKNDRIAQLDAAVKAIDFSALDRGDQALFDASVHQAQVQLQKLASWLKQFSIRAVGNSHKVLMVRDDLSGARKKHEAALTFRQKDHSSVRELFDGRIRIAEISLEQGQPSSTSTSSLNESHLHMTVTTGEALYIIAQKNNERSGTPAGKGEKRRTMPCVATREKSTR